MPDETPATKPTTSQARKEYFKKYYESHREYYKQRNAAWWKAHPEKLRAKWKRKYLKHRATILAKQKLKRCANVEYYRAKNREWQKRMWPHRQRYVKEWNKRNKIALRPKKVVAVQKRRAIQRNVTIDEERVKSWMLKVRAQQTAICHWCQNRIPANHIHFDHVVSLCKGGSHSLSNLCVSCKHCNLSKGRQSLKGWKKMDQVFLDL